MIMGSPPSISETNKRKDLNLLGSAKPWLLEDLMLSPSGHSDVIPRARSHPDYCSSRKKSCKTAVSSFWPLCTNTSVTLWGQKRGEVVGSPPNSPCAFPGGCQNLKGAAECFSWDKQAFFPLKGCCFLYSHLAVLLIASVNARSCCSGCAHQLQPDGLLNTGSLQQHPQTDMQWHIEGSDSIQSHTRH